MFEPAKDNRVYNSMKYLNVILLSKWECILSGEATVKIGLPPF